MTDSSNRPSIWNGSIIGRSNAAALQSAVDAGADVHEILETESGYSLLHCAAENGAIDNVIFLLEHGVDPKLKTATGKTASDLAREQGQNKIAELIDARL